MMVSKSFGHHEVTRQLWSRSISLTNWSCARLSHLSGRISSTALKYHSYFHVMSQVIQTAPCQSFWTLSCHCCSFAAYPTRISWTRHSSCIKMIAEFAWRHRCLQVDAHLVPKPFSGIPGLHENSHAISNPGAWSRLDKHAFSEFTGAADTMKLICRCGNQYVAPSLAW